MTVIIFTGGTASRMWPLSAEMSKCVLPFLNRPLLAYLVEDLRVQGFHDLLFTSPGRQDEVRAIFGDGSSLGLSIRYAPRCGWRRTAGTVKDMLTAMHGLVSHPVMVIYGDSLLRADYRALLELHRSRNALVTVLHHRPALDAFLYDYHDGDPDFPERGPRTNFGVLETDDSGQILRFEEKPLLAEIPEKFGRRPRANATVQVLEPAAWEHVPDEGHCDFAVHLFPSLAGRKLPIFGGDVGEGYRLDIGTLANFHAFQIDALHGRLAVSGPPRGPSVKELSDSAVIAGSADVTPPVLVASGVQIADRAQVSGSIIGDRVRIGSRAQVHDSIVLAGAQIGEASELRGCIIGPDAGVPPGTVVPPGHVLGGNGARQTFQMMTPTQAASLVRVSE